MEASRTSWTVIELARQGDAGAQRAFAVKYWPAVARYLERHGFGRDAEDLTQEVFLRLFARGVLDRVDPERGRFRGYLLGVVRRVAGEHLKRKGAQKRGSGRVPLSLEVEPATEQDDEFDREWIAQLIGLALARLQKDHPAYHQVLRALVIEGRPHPDVAREVGKTSTELKHVVYRARKKLVAFIEEEVAQYAVSQQDYAAEMKQLGRLLPG